MKRNHLDPLRVAPALGLGALSGAALVAAAMAVFGLVGRLSDGGPETSLGPLLGAAPVFVLAFIYALLVYGAGLALVGAPAWAVLHACRARSWLAAMLLGAVLNGGAVLLALALMQPPTPSELPRLAAPAALFAGFGAIVGWVIWRAAYRPSGPDTGAFS